MRDLLLVRLSEDLQHSLIANVTDEEIFSTIKSMPSNMSPGPDGFTSDFFKAAWPIVGHHVTNAVQEFFASEKLPKEFKLLLSH